MLVRVPTVCIRRLAPLALRQGRDKRSCPTRKMIRRRKLPDAQAGAPVKMRDIILHRRTKVYVLRTLC